MTQRSDVGRRSGPVHGHALFADLYVQHRRMLMAYAAGPLGWADAEDVVHDAFESLWRNGWEPHEHVGALKLATARAISHHRRHQWRECRDSRSTLPLLDSYSDDLPSPHDVAAMVCDRAVLAAFLKALTPAELQGLLRSAFADGRLSGADKSNAYHARCRLRALREAAS